MNTGLIPVRYATALLDFANISDLQDRVYTEAKAVTKSYFQFSELRTVLDNPVLAKAEKRFNALKKVEERHANAYKKVLEAL